MTGHDLARLVDRRVSPDELRQALERPIGTDEREDVLSLVRWFTGRHTSAAARLVYIRQAYARWLRPTRASISRSSPRAVLDYDPS